jgi:mRNA interferase RelE/StbE
LNGYAVELSSAAKRELRKLSPETRARVEAALFELESNPRPSGVKKLEGSSNRWRIRVGDCRIVYIIRDKVLHINVIKIAHRREAYE